MYSVNETYYKQYLFACGKINKIVLYFQQEYPEIKSLIVMRPFMKTQSKKRYDNLDWPCREYSKTAKNGCFHGRFS